jgi:hypothetical protein
MSMPAEYVTAPNGTVHLAKYNSLSQWYRTLCGRTPGDTSWSFGDETLSGIAATCDRCKTLFKKDA